MKTRRQLYTIILVSFLWLNLFSSIPKVSVASIPPNPNQFIAEIFPNCSLPLQLSHTSTYFTINATGASNIFSFHFDANYTIYYQENTTTVPLIVLISLAIDIADLILNVHVNNTQISYDLSSTTTWNENMTALEIYWLPGWIDLPRFYSNPVIFIRSNMTLFKNSTSVIRYQISSPMNNFFDSKDLVYITYYIGTSQEWIGNNSGRFKYRVYGREPIFSIGYRGRFNFISNYSTFNGGRSLSIEWHNERLPRGDFGFRYYKESTLFEIIGEYILYYISPFIGISIIIIIIIFKRKNIKRELRNKPNLEFTEINSKIKGMVISC